MTSETTQSFFTCLFGHKWEKWEQYDREVPQRTISSKWMLCGATDHMQKRKCSRCGKMTIEKYGHTVR